MNPDQITSEHRSRPAYVYIRQSSQHQVVHHAESQRRQRHLVERALRLGWKLERIVEVDEDLGQSAGRSQLRSGFEKMVAQAALGQVGLIVGLEVSRLSRGNRSWYHLLDICAVTGTLLADAEGLYDPRTYNDRLLLGLKGTMSEAELHMIKQRMVEAMHSKAKRGEFRFRLPPGYTWDAAGRMQKDPDEQVRRAIEMVFERFSRLGSVHAVQSSLYEDDIKMPVLCGPVHSICWKLAGYGYVRRMLRNPLYAGAYVYGKRQVIEVLDESQRPVKRTRDRSREEWPVLIRDHHEGYIRWDTFEKNQRQIDGNRWRAGPGAAREGGALLQGLILCGRCGRRMRVNYSNRRRNMRYECIGRRKQTGGPTCQGFGGIRLDRAVEQLVLETIQPLGVEAMIEAATAHAQSNLAEADHWRQRVERAEYEVDLARRQYESVDPANRLVARELERRWEEALRELNEIEREARDRIAELEKPLSEKDKEMLRRYAKDIPSLWSAPTTRPQDRKRILRCLIESVVVTVPEGETRLKAEVHWKGGEVTTVEVLKGRSGLHRYAAEPELVELIRNLAEEFTDEQIARILQRKKLRTPKGLTFTARRVTGLRYTHDIKGTSRMMLQGNDIYTAEEAGALLGADRSTVIRWVEVGMLKGSQRTSGAPWRVRVTEEDRRRLAAADAPEGWLPLKGAAQALGVSQQTVLQKLKSGELEGVRVKVGRRSGWRIRVASTSCALQTSLFTQGN
jgi:DNA invertase Pin-like site-specific DNA recombinase